VRYDIYIYISLGGKGLIKRRRIYKELYLSLKAAPICPLETPFCLAVLLVALVNCEGLF
jgi:hypothetical protein